MSRFPGFSLSVWQLTRIWRLDIERRGWRVQVWWHYEWNRKYRMWGRHRRIIGWWRLHV